MPVWDEEFILEKIHTQIDKPLYFQCYNEEEYRNDIFLGQTSSTYTIRDLINDYVNDFEEKDEFFVLRDGIGVQTGKINICFQAIPRREEDKLKLADIDPNAAPEELFDSARTHQSLE